MRSLLVAASLLLTALAVAPSASADPACYQHTCCNFPDPQGNPGSPGYIVTNAVHNAGHSTCRTLDDPTGVPLVEKVIYTYNCVVWGYC